MGARIAGLPSRADARGRRTQDRTGRPCGVRPRGREAFEDDDRVSRSPRRTATATADRGGGDTGRLPPKTPEPVPRGVRRAVVGRSSGSGLEARLRLLMAASQAPGAQCDDHVRFPYRCGAAPALSPPFRDGSAPASLLSRSRDRHRRTQHIRGVPIRQHDMWGAAADLQQILRRRCGAALDVNVRGDTDRDGARWQDW